MRFQRVILSRINFAAAALACGTYVSPLVLPSAFADSPAAVSKANAESLGTRFATYQTGAGDRYFAGTVQPSATDSLLKQLRSQPAAISIVVDSSASQVGDYRNDQVAALEGVLSSLRKGDTVQIFASDVATTAMSEAIDAKDTEAIRSAIAKFRRRLPLGNTNLSVAIETARAALVAYPNQVTKSLIYIGDGASIDTSGNESRIAALVDALRADQIAVHSLAVGPSKNVELLATLANQTGGDLSLVDDAKANSAELLGKQIGQYATMSPIWMKSLTLPEGAHTVQAKRLPPLRLDRDSVLIGKFTPTAASSGEIKIDGESSAGSVSLVSEVVMEPSHPDFSFLPGMVQSSTANEGLMLPTAGSPLLREAARVLAVRAEELAKAGGMALQQGSRRGANAIADMALEADPDNQEAQAVKKLSAGGYRLVVQSDEDPFGGLFSDTPAAAAPAAGDDPFAESAPAPMAAPPAVAPAPAPEPTGPVPPRPMPTRPMVAPRPTPAPPAPGRPGPSPRAAGGSMLGGGSAFAGDDDLLDAPSGLLDEVVAERGQEVGRLRAEVRAQLRAARRMLDSNPVGVAGSLKSLLNRVETQPNVDPQIRQELQAQVRSAIQISSRREAAFVDAQASASQVTAAATQTEQLLQEAFRREEQIKTLSNQLNALIDERRYDEADGDVSIALAELAGIELAGTSAIGNQTILATQMLNNYARAIRLRLLRERNFLDALALAEKSNIPFVDEPPILYPDAEQWQRMSRRRLERYGSIELTGDNEVERRISAALGDDTTQNFVEETLENAIRQISETHDIPIVIDNKALEELGINSDTPVSISLKNVSLRSFLRLMLRELDLTYMIKDEVMQITTTEAAEANPVIKVYPVGDLVVPVINLGGGGGMGGGGMGGGMGGGGGGMGGGGMGGGGMGGGGGGGMFAVPGEVTIADKKTASGVTVPFATSPTAKEVKPAKETKPADAESTKSVVSVERVRVTPTEGQSIADAWFAYFDQLKIESPEALKTHDARIRATVSHINAAAAGADQAGDVKKTLAAFTEVRDLLAAAIATGNVQPWMYRAYAISLQATGAEIAEIERAYLSAVDFADTPEEVLHVAGQLQMVGCDAAALRLCQSVAGVQPYRREAYVMGMRLAEKLDDVDGMQWACRGILGQAWPTKFEKIEADARLLARVTHQRLVERGDTKMAEAFLADLQKATSHDLIVKVTWTGDADIDIAVEEPSGTVCSMEEPNSEGGGTFLGDKFPGMERLEDDGYVSETYICPQGFTGVYRVLIRRVWGNVATGKVTVDVLSDVGRDSQKFIRQEIDLTEKDALVMVDVKEGSRKTQVGDAQIAHLRDVQNNVNQNLLGQFGGGNDPAVAQQYLRDLANMGISNGGAGIIGNNQRGFGQPGAVGFRPEITVLPEGATLLALAIISADRRYVRISPAPVFSQIGAVTTFNFVDGMAGGDVGGGAGGGAGGGVGGGGGAGGGGGGIL